MNKLRKRSSLRAMANY